MKAGTAGRLAPLSGVAFLALGLLGAVVLYPGDAPDFVDEPAKIAAFYEKNGTDLLGSGVCYLLGGVFLMWFVGTLRAHLSHAEGGSGPVAGIAFGGGVAAVVLLWASASIEAVAVLRVDENDAIDPQLAAAYWDLNSILFGLAAPYAMAVLLGASAIAAFRFGALPTWLGGLGALIALACLVPPIAFFVIIISFFWVAVTGVVLFLQGEPAAAEPAAA